MSTSPEKQDTENKESKNFRQIEIVEAMNDSTKSLNNLRSEILGDKIIEEGDLNLKYSLEENLENQGENENQIDNNEIDNDENIKGNEDLEGYLHDPEEVKAAQQETIGILRALQERLDVAIDSSNSITDSKEKEILKRALPKVFEDLEKEVNDSRQPTLPKFESLQSRIEGKVASVLTGTEKTLAAAQDTLGTVVDSIGLGKKKEKKKSVEERMKEFLEENSFIKDEYEQADTSLRKAWVNKADYDSSREGIRLWTPQNIEEKIKVQEINVELLGGINQDDPARLKEGYERYVLEENGTNTYAEWVQDKPLTNTEKFKKMLWAPIAKFLKIIRNFFKSFKGEDVDEEEIGIDERDSLIKARADLKGLKEEHQRENKRQEDIKSFKEMEVAKDKDLVISDWNDARLDGLSSEQILSLQEILSYRGKEEGEGMLLGISLKKNLKIETLLRIKEKQEHLEVEKEENEYKLYFMRKGVKVRELNWDDEEIESMLANAFNWNELKLTGDNKALTELEVSDLGGGTQPNLNDLLDSFEKGDKDFSEKEQELQELIVTSDKVRNFLKQLNKARVATQVGSNGFTKTGELTLKLLKQIEEYDGLIELDLNDGAGGEDKVDIFKEGGGEGDLKAKINGNWIDFDSFKQLGMILDDPNSYLSSSKEEEE